MIIPMNSRDLTAIKTIVDEFQIDNFELIYDGSSGIGYTLDISFSHVLNERVVTTTVEVVTSDSW